MKKLIGIFVLALLLVSGVSAFDYSDSVDSNNDGVGIAPTTLYEDESIECVYNTTLSTPLYTWYKNGYEQTSRTSASVSSTYLNAGDDWKCVVEYQVYVWYGSYGNYVTYTLGNEEVEIQSAIVEDSNAAPIMDNIIDQTVTEEDTVSLTLRATDADGDDLEFSLSVSGLSSSAYTFDSQSGEFEWVTEVGDAGEYEVTTGVSDGSLSDSDSFTITVKELVEETYAPYVTDRFLTVAEGDLVDFDVEYLASYWDYVFRTITTSYTAGDTVYVYDSDSIESELTYSFTSPLDTTNGDWQTQEGDAGSYTATITVTDTDGNSTTVDLRITVTDVPQNECPSVTMPDITVTEGDYVSASDYYVIVDSDDSIHIVTVSEPLENNGNWQTQEGDAGVYDVTLSVNDGECVTEEEFVLTVIEGPCEDSNSNGVCDNEEECPTVTVEDIAVAYGEPAFVTFVTNDAQSDPLAVVVTSSDFSDSRISWTEGDLDFTIDTQGLDAGDYEVSILVSDGQCDAEYTFILTVEEAEIETPCEDLNSNGVCDDEESCPLLDVTDVSVAYEETQGTGTISVSDEEDDSLSVTFSSEDLSASRISFDESGSEFTVNTSGLDSGSYEVTITLSDGQCDTNGSFTVIVEGEVVEVEENVAPVLADIADIEIDEGETLEIVAIATDANGDNLIYTFDGLDEAIVNDNILTWSTNFGDAGLYNVTVTVSDGELQDSTTLQVKVNDLCSDKNDDGVCDTINTTVDYEGDLLSVTEMVILNANRLVSSYDVSDLELEATGVFYIEDGYLKTTGSDSEIVLYVEMHNRNTIDAENLQLTFVLEGEEYFATFNDLTSGAKSAQTYSLSLPDDLKTGKYSLVVYVENDDIYYMQAFNFDVKSLGDYIESPGAVDTQVIESTSVKISMWTQFLNWVNSLF
jgi:hypothetical protein